MFVAFKKVKIMSENIQQVQSLLDSVSEIIKKHENMALLTGEKYNVFDIIGIKNREVTLHSAMLGNLLNAKGSHGMKGKFLELFQNVLDEKVRGHNENVNKIYDKSDSSEDSKDKNEEILVEILYSRQFISEEECNDTIMEIEKSIGKKNEDEGGRIDLYISKGENAIIIENKIYAEEQYNQLIRYFNYNDKAAIVFLTLYGDKPNSTKDNKGNNISNKVICLSYKEDIIKWLELCMKEVYDKPLILYSLKQYQNLIKLITNQSINKIMSKEILDTIFKNSYNIKNAFKILNSKIELGKRLTNLIIDEVEKTAKEKGIETSSNDLKKLKSSGMYDIKKFSNIYLKFEIEENKKIMAKIQFYNDNENTFFIGISKDVNIYEEIRTKIISLDDYNYYDPSNYKKPKENWYYGKTFTTNDFLEFTNSIEETEPIKFFKDCVEICLKVKNN